MPSVSVVGAGSQDEDVPLLNPAEGGLGGVEVVDSFLGSDDDQPRGYETSDTEFTEDERERRMPKEDGRFYDDPLWYGKTLAEIRGGTEGAKAEGNKASGEGDWKQANRCWKDSLKGAEKIKDLDLQIRLRLNLALGYVKREKPTKALDHCDAIFAADLLVKALPEQRAKAHYRRAEAHSLAGDESKAMASLRACLEIDAGNVEAQRRLAQLRKAEAERRDRERELFKGLAMGDKEFSAREGADEQQEEEEEERPDQGPHAPAPAAGPLTDRKRASRLTRGLGSRMSGLGCSLNVECLSPLTVVGPLNPSASANPQDEMGDPEG